MSIAPPSDIVLDVAQAADPQRLQAATSKLAKMASGTATVPDDFATLLTQAGGGSPSSPTAPTLRNSTMTMPHTMVVNQPASPYRKFEAVLLQTFVQEIIPKDEQLFGDAASADISPIDDGRATGEPVGQIRQDRHRPHDREGACPASDRLGAHGPHRARRRRGRSRASGFDIRLTSPAPIQEGVA